MNPAAINRIDLDLTNARTAWHHCRSRGDTIGVIKIWRILDSLLDDRLAAAGHTPIPVDVAPECWSPNCGRVMSRYGTAVWLCSECDFVDCLTSCGRKARHALEGPSSAFCATCYANANTAEDGGDTP